MSKCTRSNPSGKARMEKIDKQFNSTGMQHIPVFGSLAKAMHSITASAGSDE